MSGDAFKYKYNTCYIYMHGLEKYSHQVIVYIIYRLLSNTYQYCTFNILSLTLESLTLVRKVALSYLADKDEKSLTLWSWVLQCFCRCLPPYPKWMYSLCSVYYMPRRRVMIFIIWLFYVPILLKKLRIRLS